MSQDIRNWTRRFAYAAVLPVQVCNFAANHFSESSRRQRCRPFFADILIDWICGLKEKRMREISEQLVSRRKNSDEQSSFSWSIVAG
jgi:hypothetical protein